MKILLVHNYYTDRCGEDAVFEAQTRILRAHGHEVETFVRHNAPVARGLAGNVRAFCSGFGNPFVARDLAQVLDTLRPEVVHAHNVTPMISAMALGEIKKRGIPLVMTAHQYRLTCPESHHLRHGKVCTECLGKSGFACIRHNCWGSLPRSVAHAGWHFAGASLFPFKDTVDALTVLSDFQRDILVEGGWPRERVHVVHNPAEGEPQPAQGPGEYFAYVGRVGMEKGLGVLTAAARRLPDVLFKITGTAAQLAPFDPPSNMQPVGWLDPAQLDALYRGACAVILPSLLYETWGLCLTEAALRGRPAVASRIGGIPAVVEDGRTGILVEPGDAGALAQAVERLHRDPALAAQMGEAARERMILFSPTSYEEKLRLLYGELIRGKA